MFFGIHLPVNGNGDRGNDDENNGDDGNNGNNEITAEVEIKAEMESIWRKRKQWWKWIQRRGKLKWSSRRKVYATASASPKPEITQICWQDGLRYLQLRWFLQ